MSNGNDFERLWKLQATANKLVLDGKRKAEDFCALLQDFIEVKSNIASNIIHIDRSTPFDPVAFMGKDWSILKGPKDGGGLSGEEEQDNRSLALTEIDLNKVSFKTMLENDEKSVGGEEKLKRLIASSKIRPDAKAFQTLWENKHLVPESWKKKTNGNTTYIFFDGTILRSPNGNRCVLCLYWDAGRWRWDGRWLDDGFDANSPSLVLPS